MLSLWPHEWNKYVRTVSISTNGCVMVDGRPWAAGEFGFALSLAAAFSAPNESDLMGRFRAIDHVHVQWPVPSRPLHVENNSRKRVTPWTFSYFVEWIRTWLLFIYSVFVSVFACLRRIWRIRSLTLTRIDVMRPNSNGFFFVLLLLKRTAVINRHLISFEFRLKNAKEAKL